MTALLLAVFIASVVGSLHCAGMCGPLLACAVATPEPTRPSAQFAELGVGFGGDAQRNAWRAKLRLQGLYHGGRLLSYTALGAVAGGAGALLDLGGVLAGIQPIAATAAGAIMVLIGLIAVSYGFGGRLRRLAPPRWWTAFVARAQRFAVRWPAGRRAWWIGVCTTLLPCGWLYAFAVVAAGTGSVAWGAAVMAVFWLGTVPLMAALGTGLQGALGLAGRKLPVATGLAMIVLGLVTLTHRLGLDAPALAAQVQNDAAQTTSLVPNTDATPACCELSELHRDPASAEGKRDAD